jgi:hypothetical protein
VSTLHSQNVNYIFPIFSQNYKIYSQSFKTDRRARVINKKLKVDVEKRFSMLKTVDKSVETVENYTENTHFAGC